MPGDRYKLVWHDEFDGDTIDRAKWTSGLPWKGKEDYHWHNDSYLSYITDDDVIVRDGQLHLTCRKTPIKGLTRTFDYTEGMIHTAKTYQFRYGYAEIRAKAPHEAGKGMWPAFWTLAEGKWPPEFDIIEIWTADPKIHQGYCSAWDGKGHTTWDSHHANVAMPGYHTYGMEWGPGYAIFNLDGVVTKRVHGPHVTSDPQYLILNSGVVSGKGSKPLDANTAFPNSFDVDYCRVYQREPTPVLHNSDFALDELTPWKATGEVSIVKDDRRALRLSADARVEQTVFGLKPNTTYEISAAASVNDPVASACIGVEAPVRSRRPRARPPQIPPGCRFA
ncbi:MAG: glycoside hydrolase family 16 protein [Tepidisphaeraceae bacterium]